MATDPLTAARGVSWWKRALDVSAAAALLLFLSPLLLLIALIIRRTSPGPALFRQRRLGLGEEPFEILKFRSMVVNAPKLGPGFTSNRDPRITRIGALLRATSLDELPQLFNVLGGTMSLVGPRPCVGFELDGLPAEVRQTRASVLPGITGLAQVRGRSKLSADQSLAYDVEYARRSSLAFDLQILGETVLVVLSRRGTN